MRPEMGSPIDMRDILAHAHVDTDMRPGCHHVGDSSSSFPPSQAANPLASRNGRSGPLAKNGVHPGYRMAKTSRAWRGRRDANCEINLTSKWL